MRPFRQQTTVTSLPKRLKQIADGSLLLPPDDARSPSNEERVAVFEALIAGLPLGTVTVWRTSAARATDRSPGGIPLSGEASPGDGTVHDIVVAGARWLRILYEELGAGLTPQTLAAVDIAGPVHRETFVWFDCRQNVFTVSAAEPSPETFRVDGLLDAPRQHAFQKRLAKLSKGQRLAARFAQLVDAVFDYPIPVTRFVQDDEELVDRLTPRLGLSPPVLAAPSRWWCDDCGREISQPKDGWVEWLVNGGPPRRGSSLRLVHHLLASRRGGNDGCYLTRHELPLGTYTHDHHLEMFLGEAGRVQLYGIALDDRVPSPPILRMIRRLHERGYEEARYFFEKAAEDEQIEPGLPEERRPVSDVLTTLEWAQSRRLRQQSYWRPTFEQAVENDLRWEATGRADDAGDSDPS